MIGQTVGHYRVLAQLGAGGMVVVYRAHDTQLDRDVALKVLPAETLADETARSRLLREAQLASKLSHPHICTVYEVGEANPSAGAGPAVAYIAMELVEGQSLSARLGEGALPLEQVLRYGGQLADALAHAHARRVVHRDFKSVNVVVTAEGRTKILDFGLARRLTDEQLADATTVSQCSLTAPGVVAGTLAYMAPEQLKGQPADERSDIWALGVVLYEMAAGARPFRGQTGFELTSAILKEPPPPLPAAVPAPLQVVVGRCLAKDPGERYQRGSDVQAALEAVQAGTATVPWPGWRAALGRRRVRGPVAGAAAVLVVAATMFGFDIGGLRSRLTGATSVPARAIRLAVLPFANDTGDPAQEWFSDAMTGEMITQLGRLHPGRLDVIARTSVMHYKKTTLTLGQIARELGGADYVLEGSARQDAKVVRISADLVKVADQTQLWANAYERDRADIVVVQSDVAQKVAGALALKLLPAEEARLAGAKPIDPEAYDLCLRGYSYADRLTVADLDTAEQYFQRALAKDPKSALAYAGISSVWRRREQMTFVAPREAAPKAKAAALKAVELDDSLASGHVRLASVLAYEEWDWAGAEREMRRALELAPNDVGALPGYSHVLMMLKRPDEALQRIERALELDPLSVGSVAMYAVDLLCVRRYDEAIVQARKALRMQPDQLVAAGALYQALFCTRKYDELLALDRRDAAGDPDVKAAFEKGLAEGGYPGSQKRWADVLAARYEKAPGMGASGIASVYLFAGDNTRALDYLERAADDRDPDLPYVSCNPVFDPLRANPRFQSLLRRMGLPQ